MGPVNIHMHSCAITRQRMKAAFEKDIGRRNIMVAVQSVTAAAEERVARSGAENFIGTHDATCDDQPTLDPSRVPSST
jgi:hypothetical protein